MSVVRNIYELTETLSRLVAVAPKDENRESYIERVEELLEKRERLLSQLQPPFTGEGKKLGAAIVKMNEQIDRRLNARKEEVAVDIRKLKQKKQRTNQYVNPYENLSFDGTFYDQRK